MKRNTVRGLSPSCPETPDGKQSKIDVAFDLICPDALFALARVLQEGREKGRTTEGWKSIPAKDHLNHALMHIYGHLGGDRQEDHLQHAFCRLMMAWSTDHDSRETPSYSDIEWVYLCYPFKDDPVRRTNEIMHWAARHYDPGIHYFIPHPSMAYLREEDQRMAILARCLAAVGRCKRLWIVEHEHQYELSSGMSMEVDEALRLGIPVERKSR